MDIEAVTESMWQHTLRRSYFPAEWKGRLTIEQAYRVQLGLLDRWVARGERLAGWKVGLTAPVIQKQFGMHEPVMGFLLESGHRDGGARFRHDDLIQPGFENELCLTVGSRLEGPNVTRAQARAAITAVQPAFELIETRGDFRADVTLALTDNCQQKAFVTGPASPLPAGWEPAQHDGGGLHQRSAGRPRHRQRGDRAPPRRCRLARQEARRSSAGESRPGTGSCRAPSRSSTRSRAGTASRPASPRSARSRRSSTESIRLVST